MINLILTFKQAFDLACLEIECGLKGSDRGFDITDCVATQMIENPAFPWNKAVELVEKFPSETELLIRLVGREDIKIKEVLKIISKIEKSDRGERFYALILPVVCSNSEIPLSDVVEYAIANSDDVYLDFEDPDNTNAERLMTAIMSRPDFQKSTVREIEEIVNLDFWNDWIASYFMEHSDLCSGEMLHRLIRHQQEKEEILSIRMQGAVA